MRLLLVEDDPMIGASVHSGLRQEGHSVDWVRDGAAAELAIANGVYELILLDLGLPRKTGLELLAGLRRKGVALDVYKRQSQTLIWKFVPRSRRCSGCCRALPENRRAMLSASAVSSRTSRA